MQQSRISFPFLVGPAGTRPLAALLLLFLLAPSAWAGTASLVADIDPRPGYSPGDPVYSPRDLHAVGNRALFFVLGQLWSNDDTPGGSQPLDTQECSEVLGTTSRALFLKCGFGFTTDLWASDGTSAGTLKLSATLSQPGGQSFYAFTSDALFFIGCQGSSCGLWKSDGTAKGTVLVRSGIQAFDMTAVGRSVFYLVVAGGEELWTSDGTAAGTRKLALFPAASISSMVSAAGKLFFLTGAPADAAAPTANIALWVSDGTSGGTRKLTSFVAVEPTARISDQPLPTDRLLLVADDGVHGFQVWTSDGTPAGTREVTRFADGGGEQVYGFGTVGKRLLFNSTRIPPGNLYVSGGTPETTVPLANCASTCPIYGAGFLALGERTLFVGYADFDHRDGSLWVTDGTGPGTRKLGGPPSGLSMAVAGKAYFRDASGLGVWRTDGTPSGTVRIAGGSRNLDLFQFPFEAAAASDRIYFLNDAGFGYQLWSSTGARTRALTTFNEDGVGSFPFGLVPFGDGVIFIACDGDALQLWASGGTAATTRPATTAIDRCTASDPAVFNPPVSVGGRVFYFGKFRTLWRTDGTPAGTSELSLPSGFQLDYLAAFGGRLLALVRDGAGQDHFFTNDGTSTEAVELTLPEPLAIHGPVQVLGPRFYFAADPPGSQGPSGLWVSDGTTAGTHRVADFGIELDSNPPISYRGSDYFVSYLGLWRTDGTPEGTVQILTTNGVGNPPLESISDLTVAGGLLFFFGEQRPERQQGLYRTDGTAAGTIRLKTLSLAHPLDGPALVEAVGHLFFTADDGAHGVELWQTDGSKTGTALVADLGPGAGSSHPGSLTATPNLLFFNADDGEHGAELWQTDGTEAGTRLVDDINPGSPPSDPEALTVAGNRLFFRADDGITGNELWSYPLAGPSCQPSATALCLAGGRFRVEAHWRTLTSNGSGQAVALTPETGYFWFFDPANVEVILKVLDARSVNQHFWAFYGALSDVDYTLTITDTVNGATRRYTNPPGNLASLADTTAFGPLGANAAALLTFGPAPSSASRGDGSPAISSTAVATPCVAGPSRLCLNGGRFAVTASWRDPQGQTGSGHAVPLAAGSGASDTGYFWFFDAANVEVVFKVLDGRAVNGKFWVFYGALSNLQYTLTVTDTATGAVKTYTNPQGNLASVADTTAFP